MGAEDFQVTLHPDLSSADVLQTLSHDPRIRALNSRLASEQQYVMETAEFIVEFEFVEGPPARLSMKVAVCQGEAVDEFFGNLVVKFALDLRASIEINDEVPEDARWMFAMPAGKEVLDVIKRAIPIKRALWDADFGASRAKVTCAEAIRRFVVESNP